MIKINFPKFGVMEAVVALLLILYPTLMLAVKGGMNGVFLLLFLIAAGVLAIRPKTIPAIVWDSDSTLYLIAMAALPIAIFLSQSYHHHHYSGHPYDAASRFVLAVPIFMLLRRMRLEVFTTLQYGFPIAAIAGCLMARDNGVGRFGITTLDLIHFGNFELILGVLSMFCINWTGRDSFMLRALKIIGFMAGIYASIISGSRGGWIALPVFALLFIYFKFGKVSLKAIAVTSLVLLLSCLIAFTSSKAVHQRVDALKDNLAAFHQGNLDTSAGVRFQLYKAAGEIFAQHPVFGVGPEGFALEMDPMLKIGKITPLAAELGKGEVHNELLSKAAGMGIFGLLAMLSVYWVPLRIFYRASLAKVAQVRQSGMLGMVFVCAFIVFGLTSETLNLTLATAFYSLTVAVLLAACCNIYSRDEESSSSDQYKDIHV